MIKRFFSLLIVVLTCNMIFSETMPLELPREAYEPTGLNPKYTLDIPENFKNQKWGPETQKYNNTVDKFIGSLQSVASDDIFPELSGLNFPVSGS